jgi:DNA-directed RNA polymerase specialized sigma24 family protein
LTQLSFTDFSDEGDGENLDILTDAELEVYIAVEEEGIGVRELAHETDRRPGMVGNLLKRACLRLEDRAEKVSNTW